MVVPAGDKRHNSFLIHTSVPLPSPPPTALVLSSLSYDGLFAGKLLVNSNSGEDFLPESDSNFCLLSDDVDGDYCMKAGMYHINFSQWSTICSASQQYVTVFQGQICSDKRTPRQTEIKAAIFCF